MKSRRRSSSASRTLDSTVTLVGRIGASLRISSRKKAKELKQLNTSKPEENCWLQSGAHYTTQHFTRVPQNAGRLAIERRRSTCSAVFFANNKTPSLQFAEEEEELEKGPIVDCPLSPLTFDKDNNNKLRLSRSSLEISFHNHPEEESPEWIDEDNTPSDEVEEELMSLALVPVPYSRSTVCSPVHHYSTGLNAPGSRSCPSTPQMHRRRYLNEGSTQLTSLSTLSTHHRYLFLFNDLLLISKQKGENSYKLKEKISLDLIWLSSNNCTHSFLIGWPVCNNYIAHFSCENEKNDWFNKLNECIRRRLLTPKTTFIGLAVRIEGRQQIIRQEVQNGKRASEIIHQLTSNLDLPALDPHLQHYELGFETGKDVSAHNHPSSSTNSAVNNTGATSLFHQHLHTLSSGSSAVFRALNGVENVYAILMDHVSGLALSETQLTQLDTCPLVNCRLVLRQTSNSGGSSRGSNAALNIVNQFRKVLSRTESSSKRLFGRQLEGSMPPQPVLTMIDFLTMNGAGVEGIFRKSPKQATVRVLRTQLDQGQVPDFHQFNVHVTASLLKEYLRSIPGQLLISSNYNLWMDICEEGDSEKKLKMCRNLLKLLPACHTVLLRSVVRLLRQVAGHEQSSKMNIRSLAVCIAPSLLENPNIVDSAKKVPELVIYMIEKAADLFDGFAEDSLLPRQEDENSRRLHQSTDSGLSDDTPHGYPHNTYSSVHKRKHTESSVSSKTTTNYLGVGVNNSSCLSSSADPLPKSVSPDSALFENGLLSDCSNFSGDEDKKAIVKIEEIESCMQKHAKQDDEEDQYQPSSADRTPTALSRENSDVKTKYPNQWKSHINTNTAVKPSSLNQIKKMGGGSVVHKQHTIQEISSPDLSARADVRVLRLKPNSASPAASPLLNSERFKRINSANFVSNLDDLRVSDYIRVGGELVNSSQKNGYKPVQKASESTNLNRGGAAIPSTNGLRRTALLSRNESLGLATTTPSSITAPVNNSQQAGKVLVSSLSSQQPNLASRQQKPVKKPPFNSSTSIKRVDSVTASPPTILNASKSTGPKTGLPANPSRSIHAGGALLNRNPSAVGSNYKTPTAINQAQSTVNNKSTPPLARGHSVGGSFGQQTAHKTVNSKPTVNSRRRLSELRSIGGANTSLDRCASMPKPNAAWRPAKKTAEEIVLDKLEVNWSVTSIREVFQQNKDVKPATIDTLFGVEHNFTKQRAVATATIGGKSKPFTA